MNITKLHSPRAIFRDPFFANPLSLLNDVEVASVRSFSPDGDIVESNERYELHLALPGFKKEDVKIDLKNDMLTISGERKFVKEENKQYHIIQTSFGKFTKSYTLNHKIDKSSILAEFKDGILVVQLPKKEKELENNAQIEIR